MPTPETAGEFVILARGCPSVSQISFIAGARSLNEQDLQPNLFEGPVS
jgi:hypothetical protein